MFIQCSLLSFPEEEFRGQGQGQGRVKMFSEFPSNGTEETVCVRDVSLSQELWKFLHPNSLRCCGSLLGARGTKAREEAFESG